MKKHKMLFFVRPGKSAKEKVPEISGREWNCFAFLKLKEASFTARNQLLGLLGPMVTVERIGKGTAQSQGAILLKFIDFCCVDTGDQCLSKSYFARVWRAARCIFVDKNILLSLRPGKTRRLWI
ncbi:hypothetical protein QWY86_05380 [Pedobacter aquatilis]|uniref:hypothetical protein n=1 Tax=Pedobacter aquatilis TaxID=351343 RepID=UPI0025B55D1F|nr:hypothetical protein [Pedobacter aquatilis]MDN3586088.1 hypothetical protein [Pedobacter aquatilis]